MANVVAVSAHADDMEIGMGGTVVKLAHAGHTITSVVLTDGRRSSNPFAIPEEELVQRRRAEAGAAAEILGVSHVVFCDLENLTTESHFKIAKQKLRQLFQDTKPAEIYTLHPELDRHPSHRLAGKAVLEALQENRRDDSPVLWFYEVWGLFPSWHRFEDISTEMDAKLRSIEAHKSQVDVIPYGEGVAGLNRWRAVFADPHQASSPCSFGEVFVKFGEKDAGYHNKEL